MVHQFQSNLTAKRTVDCWSSHVNHEPESRKTTAALDTRGELAVKGWFDPFECVNDKKSFTQGCADFVVGKNQWSRLRFSRP